MTPFDAPLDAVAAWEADALDIVLQRDKPVHNNVTVLVARRETTIQAIAHAESLVQALFSTAVSDKFDGLLRSHVSINNVLNTESEKSRKDFVIAAASEMGLLGS